MISFREKVIKYGDDWRTGHYGDETYVPAPRNERLALLLSNGPMTSDWTDFLIMLQMARPAETQLDRLQRNLNLIDPAS